MRPIDLWGQIGSYVPLDPPADLRPVIALVDRPGSSGRELKCDARLQVVGSRIGADVDGVNLGWLPTDISEDYLAVLSAILQKGCFPRVGAGVRVYDPNSLVEPYPDVTGGLDVYASNYLRLAPPHLLEPQNAAPGDKHLLIPEGRKQKVSVLPGGAGGVLSRWIYEAGSAWVYCTLHPRTEQLSRTTREVIEVRVDDSAVGTLSPAMSKAFLPLTRLIESTHRITAARGLIRGNRLETEMSVAGLKSSEVTQAWLREHGLEGAIGQSVPLSAPPISEDPIEAIGDGRSGPGFYADPRGMADERFWDGEAWTSRIRMRPTDGNR